MRVTGPGQPQPRSEVDAETRVAEELSLWDFVDPLLSAWVQIAVITVIGAAVAFSLASLRRPVYEATAMVRVIGDQVDAVRTAAMRPLLENRSVAGELIQEFAITTDPAWTFLSGSRPAAADAFLTNHVTVEQTAGTNLLRVNVRLGNAELAARVANELVARGNARNRIIQKDVIDALDSLKTRLDEAGKRLEALQGAASSAPIARASPAELQTAIDYERTLLAYLDLSTRYEDARIRAGNLVAPFQIVDPAVPPSAPLSPRVMVITQLGGVLALLLGCFLVLARHFFSRHRLT